MSSIELQSRAIFQLNGRFYYHLIFIAVISLIGRPAKTDS